MKTILVATDFSPAALNAANYVLPKRHGLLDKLIHKSHTKQLVLHSHVPVMAFHQ